MRGVRACAQSGCQVEMHLKWRASSSPYHVGLSLFPCEVKLTFATPGPENPEIRKIEVNLKNAQKYTKIMQENIRKYMEIYENSRKYMIYMDLYVFWVSGLVF